MFKDYLCLGIMILGYLIVIGGFGIKVLGEEFVRSKENIFF